MTRPAFEHGNGQLASLDELLDIQALGEFVEHAVDVVAGLFGRLDDRVLVDADARAFEVRLDQQGVGQFVRQFPVIGGYQRSPGYVDAVHGQQFFAEAFVQVDQQQGAAAAGERQVEQLVDRRVESLASASLCSLGGIENQVGFGVEQFPDNLFNRAGNLDRYDLVGQFFEGAEQGIDIFLAEEFGLVLGGFLLLVIGENDAHCRAPFVVDPVSEIS